MTQRNSESRHLGEQHSVRTSPGVWPAALDRARREGHRGLAALIEGWLEAYADGRLDAMPGGYRLARPSADQSS